MKRDVFLFRFSCVSFAVSALSVLLFCVGDYKGNGLQKLFAFLTGFLFWTGLPLGIASIILVNAHRKKNKSFNSARNMRKRIGFISFLSNKSAVIFDVAMIALFILFLVSKFIPLFGEEIDIIIFTLLLFSIYMHSMFNGVNFLYIKLIKKECKK